MLEDGDDISLEKKHQASNNGNPILSVFHTHIDCLLSSRDAIHLKKNKEAFDKVITGLYQEEERNKKVSLITFLCTRRHSNAGQQEGSKILGYAGVLC